MRTVPTLLQSYSDAFNFSGAVKSPTELTLYQWSSRFKWADRAQLFDGEWDARKNAERAAVLDMGLALDYERIKKLRRLAEFLEGQLYERGVLVDPETSKVSDKPGPYHNVWVPDVKSIGSGEFAERVDIERFNGELLTQYRGVLDDIAKETGGRIKKSDITSGGKAIPIMVTKMDMDEL